MNRLRLFLIAVIAFVVVVALLIAMPTPRSTAFSNMSLPLAESGELFLISSEGPVILNFFASWCRNCTKEQSEFSALKTQIPKIQIYGLLLHDKVSNIAGKKLVFDKVFAGDAVDALARKLKVSGVPETFLISHGKIYKSEKK